MRKLVATAVDQPVQESGLLFTDPLGRPIHPSHLSDYFKDLIAQAGLPPVRLHGRRHGAATVLLAARVDLKIVSTTADLYTSVVAELTRDALAAGAATITQHRTNSTNGQDQPTPTGTDGEEVRLVFTGGHYLSYRSGTGSGMGPVANVPADHGGSVPK